MFKTIEIPLIGFLFPIALCLICVGFSLLVLFVTVVSGVPLEIKNNTKELVNRIRNRKQIVLYINNKEQYRIPYTKKNYKKAIADIEKKPRSKVVVVKNKEAK